MKFTQADTEGYTDEQLAEFNAQWSVIEATIDSEDLDELEQSYKAFCDEVSKR